MDIGERWQFADENNYLANSHNITHYQSAREQRGT
jgi:hypothetical protein